MSVANKIEDNLLPRRGNTKNDSGYFHANTSRCNPLHHVQIIWMLDPRIDRAFVLPRWGNVDPKRLLLPT